MDGIFMVNWSGQSIPTAEMMVMRRFAVEMRAVHGVKEVGFVHDLCAGIVRYEKTGVYGASGGLIFFGDFGARNNQPNTVDFFIPRYALRKHSGPRIIIGQSMRREGNKFVSDGYPEDIDEDTASGAGKLKITVRREE